MNLVRFARTTATQFSATKAEVRLVGWGHSLAGLQSRQTMPPTDQPDLRFGGGKLGGGGAGESY